VPLSGVRDDLLRERDELVDDAVGDVAPPDARLRAGSPGFLDLQVFVMGRVGIEPTTLGLRVPCSTS